jgi:hypothetical protein
MRNGLLVYFGDAARPHAKWLSLARVLADSTSAGAVYIDVRVPERPAAGFSSADAPAASMASTGQQQATTPEATVAALAAGLTDDTNGEPAASSAATPATGSTSTTEATSTAPGAAESSTGTTGTTATSEPETPAASAPPGG